MKKILLATLALTLTTPVWAAQQNISTITTKQSREELRGAINTELGKVQSNTTELYSIAITAPWLAQATAPNVTNVFWVDTSGASPVIKYYDGDSWEVAAAGDGGTYTLPTASTETKGGVIVGDRLSIDANGVLSADVQTTDISGKEDSLGNPSTNGYVLSSTTTGTRSWIEMTGGGTGISHATSDGNYYASRNGGWASLTGLYAPALGADDNYATDAEKVKLSNLSGTNTGDQVLPTDATISTSDVTTNDASTSKHGWAPKATPPSSGLRNVMAIDNGETAYKNAALFDTTSPSTQAFGDSAAAGSAMAAARRDHKHAMPAAQTAATTAFTPNGTIAATTVQGAIEEVRDEAGGPPLPETCPNDQDILEWDTTTLTYKCSTPIEITASAPVTFIAGVIGITANTYQAYDADWLGVTANGASLISAANYAAMRTLLDLEPGTDFYSMSGADTAFQPKNTNLTSWASIAPGSGVGTFLATPSSSNLATAVTGETGSGALVFGTSPSLTTPSITVPEVNGSSSTTLTAAQVSSTIVYNTGMGGADVALTLPTAAAGYSALFQVGTAQSFKWGVQAGANDKIYLLAADGTISAGADNGYARMTAAQIGQSFACWTIKTDAYDWQCKAVSIGTSTFAAN